MSTLRPTDPSRRSSWSEGQLKSHTSFTCSRGAKLIRRSCWISVSRLLMRSCLITYGARTYLPNFTLSRVRPQSAAIVPQGSEADLHSRVDIVRMYTSSRRGPQAMGVSYIFLALVDHKLTRQLLTSVRCSPKHPLCDRTTPTHASRAHGFAFVS